MAVVMIDGSTILSFLNDEVRFSESIRKAFTSLDLDRDGVLSRQELRRGMELFRLLERDFGVDVPVPAEEVTAIHDAMFEMFDRNKTGGVDEEEFKNEMKNMLTAIADGLGLCTVWMVLEDGDELCFLKQAAYLEASRVSSKETLA